MAYKESKRGSAPLLNPPDLGAVGSLCRAPCRSCNTNKERPVRASLINEPLFRSAMRKALDVMRRHWCITIWRDADGTALSDDDGVIDLSRWLEDAIDTARGLRARYLCWSLEDSQLEMAPPATLKSGQTGHSPVGTPKPPKGAGGGNGGSSASAKPAPGGLHIHVYIECERSVRWSTVKNRFQFCFQGAHVEPKRGWRDSAREYHMGLKNGVEKTSHITHGEWGDWLEEHLGIETAEDFSETASQMIMMGSTPKEVAQHYPRWFLSRGAGVVRLWETLNRQRWTQ